MYNKILTNILRLYYCIYGILNIGTTIYVNVFKYATCV